MRLFSIILCFCFIHPFAQAPGDINMYLKSAAIPQSVKGIYSGNLKATDNTVTLRILDSLQTNNNFTRPFYLLVVSKLLLHADGALSEATGLACKKFLETKPQLLIAFLYVNDTIVDKNFKLLWANAIRDEFKIDCEHKVKECIMSSKKIAQPKCNETYKPKIDNFYSLILKGL